MRYAIWNKQDTIYTPSGDKFTAEQWIARYPIAGVKNVKIVCGGGIINGAFFGVFDDMVESYALRGCDFTGCGTDQDYLNTIEAFEVAMNTPSIEPTTDERIAAALEYQVMVSMPDAE